VQKRKKAGRYKLDDLKVFFNLFFIGLELELMFWKNENRTKQHFTFLGFLLW